MGLFDGAGSAVLGGGLGLLGGMMTNSAQTAATQEANQKQMEFQYNMSSTAHQREVADLRAAGLNPMLSGMGGSGAAMGAGSANAPTLQNALGEGVQSAIQARQLAKANESQDAQIALAKEQVNTQQMQQASLNASAHAAQAQADKTNIERAAAQAQLPVAQQQAQADMKHAIYDTNNAALDATMNRVQQATGIANSAASIIKPFTSGPSSNSDQMKKLQYENKQMKDYINRK